jgi:putative nucleotidyltransferase with HDIG domain
MKRKIETRFAAEQIAIRANWLLILAAGLLGYGHLDSNTALTSLSVLVVLNGVAYRACLNLDTYRGKGKEACSLVRLAYAGLFGFLGLGQLWALAIPAVAFEAFVSRSKLRVVVFTVLSILAEIAPVLVERHFTASLLVRPVVTVLGIMAGSWLVQYMAQGEMLDTAARRLNSLLQCGTELAASSKLSSTIMDTLKFAVQETNASCGYVMLLDDQRKDTLITETAFGLDGEFDFPSEMEIGSGLSGFAAKAMQPISVSSSGDEQREYDGITEGVRAAASVPLAVKPFSSVGQSADDQLLGVMTLLNQNTSEAFGDDDMELLRTLGSMMSVAISNSRMEERRRTTFLLTLESLATALEARDEYTRGHSQRVCEVSLMIGEKMGLGPEAIEELRVGTILHDIGKIGVPDAILNKRAKLTDEEFEIMKSHPVVGYEICMPLMLSEGVLMIIRNHHEKLDGSGYPDGLKGGELPLSLRIVCVADAFDAMSSRRPYRSVLDPNLVLAELSRCAGSQFDPVVVEQIKELLGTEQLHELYKDHWIDREEQAA